MPIRIGVSLGEAGVGRGPQIAGFVPGSGSWGPPGGVESAPMKRILLPANFGVSAVRHLAWYVSYHVSGDARH